MRCPNCNNKCPEASKFCSKCGTRLVFEGIEITDVKKKNNNEDSFEQDKSISGKTEPEQRDNHNVEKLISFEDSGEKKNGKKSIIPVIITAVILVLAVIVFLVYRHIKGDERNTSGGSKAQTHSTAEGSEDDNPEYESQADITVDDTNIPPEEIEDVLLEEAEKYEDANKFFNDFSQVVSIKKADEVTTLYNETEIISEVDDRGFGEADILTHYNTEGDYYDDTVTSSESTENHPMYETRYINSSGEQWDIFIINNEIMASPDAYNLNYLETGKMVLVSENDYIVSYDCETNQFYEVVLDDSDMIIYKVDRIDSKTLDELTLERIIEYVGE